jgi:hypothetical protein
MRVARAGEGLSDPRARAGTCDVFSSHTLFSLRASCRVWMDGRLSLARLCARRGAFTRAHCFSCQDTAFARRGAPRLPLDQIRRPPPGILVRVRAGCIRPSGCPARLRGGERRGPRARDVAAALSRRRRRTARKGPPAPGAGFRKPRLAYEAPRGPRRALPLQPSHETLAVRNATLSRSASTLAGQAPMGTHQTGGSQPLAPPPDGGDESAGIVIKELHMNIRTNNIIVLPVRPAAIRARVAAVIASAACPACSGRPRTPTRSPPAPTRPAEPVQPAFPRVAPFRARRGCGCPRTGSCSSTPSSSTPSSSRRVPWLLRTFNPQHSRRPLHEHALQTQADLLPSGAFRDRLGPAACRCSRPLPAFAPPSARRRIRPSHSAQVTPEAEKDATYFEQPVPDDENGPDASGSGGPEAGALPGGDNGQVGSAKGPSYRGALA